jgi:predicted ABC-type ATPase
MYIFRNIPSLILTPIKRAPNKPQIIPRIIPAGRSSIEFSLANARLPSFSAPESDKLSGELEDKDSKIDKVKVAIEVAVNTLQSMLNVQKVFGFEIS